MSAAVREYLVRYGTVGDFGRFRPLSPLDLERGARVVVRSHRGLELGEVLCPARPGHATFLPNTTVGPLLRPATAADEQQVESLHRWEQELLIAARERAGELGLPVEFLDAEVVLDREQAVLHYLAWAPFDERELVGPLSAAHDVRITLHRLGGQVADEEGHAGCGREGCGKSAGGCSSCGSCGSCGSGTPAELQAYFLELRRQMHAQNGGRVPLT